MKLANGTFHFLSRKAWLRVEDLDSDDLHLGWFAINWRWFDKLSRKDRRRMYGKWFRINSDYGTIFRCVRFTFDSLRKLENNPDSRDQIVLDWKGWIGLSGYGDHEKDSLKLSIRPARIWEVPLAAWKHPEPSHRLSFQIAIIALIASIISLIGLIDSLLCR